MRLGVLGSRQCSGWGWEVEKLRSWVSEGERAGDATAPNPPRPRDPETRAGDIFAGTRAGQGERGRRKGWDGWKVVLE